MGSVFILLTYLPEISKGMPIFIFIFFTQTTTTELIDILPTDWALFDFFSTLSLYIGIPFELFLNFLVHVRFVT